MHKRGLDEALTNLLLTKFTYKIAAYSVPSNSLLGVFHGMPLKHPFPSHIGILYFGLKQRRKLEYRQFFEIGIFGMLVRFSTGPF